MFPQRGDCIKFGRDVRQAVSGGCLSMKARHFKSSGNERKCVERDAYKHMPANTITRCLVIEQTLFVEHTLRLSPGGIRVI